MTDWDEFYSQQATDAWFRKYYQQAYERLDFEGIARLLSGRLRQMEKRAAAANKRADEMRDEMDSRSSCRQDSLTAETAQFIRDTLP